MPFDLYTRLLQELDRPTTLRLSYSGESGHYPRLIEAIDAAKATLAKVELVTALVSVPEMIVRAMAERLDRITVSIHTTDDDEFRRIYRYGSFTEFEHKLGILTELRRQRGAPTLDFCFVAMESNIPSLDGVVALARERYVPDVFIQPVMRREAFEYAFPELDGTGRHARAYGESLRDAVELARSRYSGVRVQVVNPSVENPGAGQCETEETAEIIECAEDPWQTVHIMSNGDVISCGWRQNQPLGNLHRASLREIWNGRPYEAFRREHRQGRDGTCRQCPFKKTHPPAPLEPRITPDHAPLRQLPAGWEKDEGGSGSLWAGANALLEMPADGQFLHLIGSLPPGPAGDRNTLTIAVDGAEIAVIENRSQELLQFNRVLGLPASAPGEPRPARVIEFRTLHEYVPRDNGHNQDGRRLGFCLGLAECADTAAGEPDVYVEIGPDRECRRRLQRLRAALALTDLVAPWMQRLPIPHPRAVPHPARPGMTVIIPERGNSDLLDQCLASVDEAGRHMEEPLQVIVAANGIQDEDYTPIRGRYPRVEFVCQAAPLTFCGAVRAGLKRARHDWVYLLNNDMTLEPGALQTLADERRDSVFALASRIVLADRGLLSYETNWTSYRVRDELLEVYHAAPPQGAGPFEILFGGGGCTLYRRALLEQYLGRFDPYAPFYFEDLDWATRGSRDGFASLLCPKSIATHQHRATINRFYGTVEAERVLQRNLLQYQLRHVIEGVACEAVLRRIARSEPRTIQDLTGWRKIASIALARMASASTSGGHHELLPAQR